MLRIPLVLQHHRKGDQIHMCWMDLWLDEMKTQERLRNCCPEMWILLLPPNIKLLPLLVWEDSARQVYNDVAAMEKFDLKIWVSVSDDFNIETVTRTISKKITSRPCDMDDFSQLQDNLRKELDGRRFVIVLDDVWSTCDYESWTKLQAPFRGGAPGSKVLVTTRDEKVAALMGAPAIAVYHLKTLSDESLQVFEQHVSNDRPPNFDLLKRKIVTNCNGLPLAAKTLGGVLKKLTNGRKY
ncbi:hypothetical protein ACLB2K_068384 [Fragaria x ananassa]